MTTLSHTMTQVRIWLETGQLSETEQFLDILAELDPDDLDEEWGLGRGGARYHLSVFYNNVGANYHGLGREAQQKGQSDEIVTAAQQAERCHEKALDMYDLSADDFKALPTESPLNKNLIFTFWGLGTSKFVLEKRDESRKYLELCLFFSPEDDQAEFWQSDASTYLRVLDGKPVQIVLRVREAIGNPFDPISYTYKAICWSGMPTPSHKGQNIACFLQMTSLMNWRLKDFGTLVHLRVRSWYSTPMKQATYAAR